MFGLAVVETGLPSPKFQRRVTMMPSESVESSDEKEKVAGATPIGADEEATASGATLATVRTERVAEPVAPRLSVTVRVTMKVPGAAKVCDGLAEVPMGEPSPQSQL